jgi:F-type H+-transporting ATPase subunit gamma
VPSLKSIRKRILSVKSTQKITRAMKMVAGARLNRAQQRITELRPYAVKTQEVLSEITAASLQPASAEGAVAPGPEAAEGAEGTGFYGGDILGDKPAHPFLVERPENRVLLVVLTSDRGLCGAFNTNINKRGEREWRTRTENGQEVQLLLIGRKGRDYFTRRNAPIYKYMPGIWDSLSLATARTVSRAILEPLLPKENVSGETTEPAIDAIYLVYNEFKSALTQQIVVERLLPVARGAPGERESATGRAADFLYEPSKDALLQNLVPMYVEISILRALYESMASELGARMTAMDAATKNAKEMISALTLQYNRARQAAITKELMEIIGGSEALKE